MDVQRTRAVAGLTIPVNRATRTARPIGRRTSHLVRTIRQARRRGRSAD